MLVILNGLWLTLSSVLPPNWLLLAQTEVGATEGAAELRDSTVQNAPLPDGGGLDEGAAGQAVEGAPNFFMEFFANPLNLILISGILFIMLVLRPQQKQMKELQQKLAGLKKNDRVVTASGIHGTVVQSAADEAVVTLRIDDNTARD